MYNIKCLNPISHKGLDLLSDHYQIVEEAQAADAILVRSASMHEMEFSDKLIAVARAGAGVNNIPLDTCAQKGIVVFNTPGANANGVKEAVLAGMLLASRDINGGIDWVKSIADEPDVAKLVEKGKKKFAGTEILGKKLGVIGLGAIGVLVANACNSLGMEVYGYDPYISVKSAWNLSGDIHHTDSLDEIYAQCDYITIHVPLMDSNRKMINQDGFSKMKDGVILLNFARDLLVDEDALEDALNSGKVRKYVTDFPNNHSVKMKNVIAIPHLGASTEESEDNCAVMAVNELVDYIENGNITNSVNYPACSMGACKGAGRVTVHHRNIPNMIAQFTSVCADDQVNIVDMINKSKGDWAYTMMDLASPVTDQMIQDMQSIDGVVKVRVVK